MKRREEEILKALKHLSKRTNEFSNPRILLIGGYALRAFISLTRFTRDCDFALKGEKRWAIDWIRYLLPEGFSIEYLEKRGSYGFMKCVKLISHGNTKIKVSLDFMEGEIRGREPKDVILIDDAMIKGSQVTIPVAGEEVTVLAPSYADYFIMKVVSARPSDIRDLASLLLELGLPSGLIERIRQILPYPEVFKSKLEENIIPVMKRKTFIDSWKGVFGTTKYREEDRRKVIKLLEKLLEELRE